jgi:hypothetical protein
MKNINENSEGSPLAPLNAAQNKLLSLLLSSYEKIAKNKVLELYSNIEFAILAIKTKINHPKDFNKVADSEELMPKKELHRLMKFVLEEDVNFRKAMMVNGKNVNIEENISLLKIDKNIQGITLKSLSKMTDPSIAKLTLMKKHLTDDEFKTVLGGDDKPYIDFKNGIKTKKHNNHIAEKPDTISADLYDSLYDGGIYPAIRQIAEFMERVNDLESEKQDFISQVSNLKGQLEAYKDMASPARFNLSNAELPSKTTRIAV